MILIALVVAVLLIGLADWLAVRRSRGIGHRVSGWLLWLLAPVYRYDAKRDAWIPRVIGNRYGPMLRPRGYRALTPDELNALNRIDDDTDDDEPAGDATTLASPPEPAHPTPDPFQRQPPNRTPLGRDDRSAAQEEQEEPLITHPRRE